MIHFIHFKATPGGIEVMRPRIISSLSEFHFYVFIIRPLRKEDVNVYEGVNCNIRFGSNNNWIVFLKLWIYGLKHKNDIFHIYNVGTFYLLVLRLAGVRKIIYSIHTNIFWRSRFQKIVRKLFWQFALSKHHKIIANSLYCRNVFREKISNKYEIDIIYNPIYINEVCKSIVIPQKTLKIIYVGRLVKTKNLKLWLEIAAKIKEKYKDTQFEMYGEGPMREEIIDYSRQLGLENSLFLKGYRENMTEVYKNSSLTMFLSNNESFGNVVVESILCGTPVIALSIPSMKEIFKNFPNFLIDIDDDIEHAIIKKIDNIGELQQYVNKAREEFQSRFSLQAHIDALKNMYSSF